MEIQSVPVDLIDPHPHNPRRDLGDLTELAASIKEQGILQNLLLVPQHDQRDVSRTGRYTAVVGHRRLAAAQLAGLETVPAVINPRLTNAEQVLLMALENIQRTNLSPIEEADAYQQALDLGVKPKDIVRLTGRSAATVHARLQLLKLPEQARQKVHTDQATLEDAAELAKLAKHPELYAAVADTLGTNNFARELREAQDQIRREAGQAAMLARLAELGIPPITPEEKNAGTTSLGAPATVDELNKLTWPDDLGTVRYRTVEWDDRVFVSILTPRDPGADAERVARRQQDEEERDRNLAEVEALFVHREAWVRTYITRKRIPAKDQLAIMAATAPLVLHCQLGLGHWQLGSFLRPDGKRNEDTPEVLAQAIADQFPDIGPAQMLLLAAHLGAGTPWTDAYRWPQHAALYGLLEQLGYPVSDAERARITPPAVEEDCSPDEVDTTTPDEVEAAQAAADDALGYCGTCAHPLADHEDGQPGICWAPDNMKTCAFCPPPVEAA